MTARRIVALFLNGILLPGLFESLGLETTLLADDIEALDPEGGAAAGIYYIY